MDLNCGSAYAALPKALERGLTTQGTIDRALERTFEVRKRLGDAFIEVLLSLSIPYTAYILAESIHLSGVLAVVAAGVMRGRYTPEIVSAEMRILARSVWNIMVFLLNSLIFMLIGMALSDVVGRI